MKYNEQFSDFLHSTKNSDFKIMEEETKDEKALLPQDIGTDYTFKRKIVWFNAIGFLVLHLLALYGCFRLPQCHILTPLWGK